jgi:hypothetical protein
MLAYDTWYEDELEENRTYRVVPFPNQTEAPYNSGVVSFYRKSYDPDQKWKVFAFSFLSINENDTDHNRCQHPLLTTQYTTEHHDEPFDLTISNSAIANCTRVHYSTDKDPTPESPYVTIGTAGNGAKPIHVDASCTLKFRTYRDASETWDGYVASAVDKRTFTVTTPNKHPKKICGRRWHHHCASRSNRRYWPTGFQCLLCRGSEASQRDSQSRQATPLLKAIW